MLVGTWAPGTCALGAVDGTLPGASTLTGQLPVQHVHRSPSVLTPGHPQETSHTAAEHSTSEGASLVWTVHAAQVFQEQKTKEEWAVLAGSATAWSRLPAYHKAPFGHVKEELGFTGYGQLDGKRTDRPCHADMGQEQPCSRGQGGWDSVSDPGSASNPGVAPTKGLA